MSHTNPQDHSPQKFNLFGIRLEQTREKIQGYAMYLTHGRHADAEDLVSAVFEKALKKRNSLRNDASLLPWLRRIAFNLHISATRKAKRQPQDFPGELPTAAVAEKAHQNMEVAHLWKRIGKLPPKRRQALTLHMYGYTVAEIAQIQEVAENTVRANLTYARADMRTYLATSDKN